MKKVVALFLGLTLTLFTVACTPPVQVQSTQAESLPYNDLLWETQAETEFVQIPNETVSDVYEDVFVPEETVYWEPSEDEYVEPEPDEYVEPAPDEYVEPAPDEYVPHETNPTAPANPQVQPTQPPVQETNPAETTPQQSSPTTLPATQPSQETDSPQVNSDVANPLTWADINAIPVANSTMSNAQLRKICTDFMRMQISFAWTPSETLSYSVANNSVQLTAGSVYGGLPYVSSTFGNLYKAMEYYDVKTGVLDTRDADILRVIGNQCSASAYWAWSRVSNAISFGGTQTILEKNGCLRLGDYTYSNGINNFHIEGIRTANICAANGEQTMYEAYALLLPADGMSMYTGSAGHVRMISSPAHVVRNSDGTINPERSSITFLDQVATWTADVQSNGKLIRTQGGVDVTVSFASLYKAGYLPFRIPELAGKDPVEKGTVSASVSGQQVTASALSGATVSANYPLSDVTLTVLDSTGKTVYRYTQPVNDLNIRQFAIRNAVKGSVLSPFADGKHTVQLSCRIGTGEKLVAYSGKLVK